MIIQGNHLNYNYMQKVQAQQDGKQSGLGSGAGMSLNTLKAKTEAAPQLSMVPKVEKTDKQQSQIQDRVDVFGDLMGRYLQGFQQPAAEGQESETKDPTALVSSLKDTVRWIENQYGEDAASASMAMIVQSSSRAQSEEAIGDGLLNVLKMVDRNFGTAAGDTAIARFNSGVNRELNEFFDNGAQELFFASEPAAAAGESASMNSRFFIQAQQAETEEEEEINPTKELMDALLRDLEEQGAVDSDSEQTIQTATAQGIKHAAAAYTASPSPDAQLVSTLA